MAKISIIVGARRKRIDVDAWPFLPGLWAHHELGSDSHYSITHRESGLSILCKVSERHLETVRSVLGRLLWDKPRAQIFEDKNYYSAIREAELLTNHDRSEKQEKRIAKDTGGKRQPASGSRWGYRRDVVTPRFLIEAKTTKSKRHAVPWKDLTYIQKQAYMSGRVPVYLISLMDTSEVAILPDQDVGDDDLPQDAPYASISCQITSKTLPVSIDMVNMCIDGTVFRIKYGKQKYIMMGYEMFLEFAKKGV